MRDWLNLVFIGTLHHVSFCFLNKVLISCARLVTSYFEKMFLAWVFTVFSLINKEAAMSDYSGHY